MRAYCTAYHVARNQTLVILQAPPSSFFLSSSTLGLSGATAGSILHRKPSRGKPRVEEGIGGGGGLMQPPPPSQPPNYPYPNHSPPHTLEDALPRAASIPQGSLLDPIVISMLYLPFQPKPVTMAGGDRPLLIDIGKAAEVGLSSGQAESK